MPIERICVFCGSSPGRTERYVSAARALGRMLAERDIGLVYGGASVGTMGALADATLDAGGEVIGVIPRQLVDRELAHRGVSDLRVVADMHERKAQMAGSADGFIALPGGAGTLEAFFEVWTWAQLGLHAKPLGLLDIDGYYQPLLTFIDRMVSEEFLRGAYRDMIIVASDPAELLDHFAAYRPPHGKWPDVPATVDPAAAMAADAPPPQRAE
ncbi:MAG TPA: TIGR00730 family Rossman fold protein [Euzebyales bacterium]|nr:TIGR00730 family Rossman fold protein [Euzebyales bacterium]